MRDCMVEIELHWKTGTIRIKPHVEVKVLVLVSFKIEQYWKLEYSCG
jgi:hypothetical protein